MDFSFVKKKEFLYPCGDNKISCHPIEVFLPAGTYRFECYGASGGTSGNGTGGYGAYVSGNIKLNSIKQMFLFIGAKGHTTVGQPTFNGGGRGHLNPSQHDIGASGGGSTDIRLINSTGLNGLVSRIIVAGAGGGGESYYYGAKGGNSGIFNGEDGEIANYPTTNSITYSEGANSTDGGNGDRCVYNDGKQCNIIRHGHSGGFGFGRSGSNSSYGGGGGSGYFGGGGGAISNSIVGSGAGGSSYVSGYEGFHTFDIENGQLKDTNSENHSSGLIFYDVVVKDGNETKYDGDGKITITRIKSINCSCENRLNDYFCIIYSLFMIFLS
jgi:hypothetical protein